MRRAIARGRVFPQSYSTDRRYGRLSLKACALYPLIWVNADDQGRLCGDPEEIKYACCPNIDHIIKADIPQILNELEQNNLVKVYDTPKSKALQILDWWDVQRLQWAWPSDFSPPFGWQDRLRYKQGAKQVVTQNWPSGESQNGAQVSTATVSGEGKESTQVTAESGSGETKNHTQVNSRTKKISKETSSPFPLTPNPLLEKEKEEERRRGRGRGNSPEPSGEKPSPSPTDLSQKEKEIYETLKENYRIRWGKVRAENPDEIIPRPLQAKAGAQLRDLATELSAAGGCPADTIKQAFDEACGQQKYSISYVRAVLFDWIGIDRDRSP